MDKETLIKNNLKLINIYIKKNLTKARALGLERNDLYQEGLIGLTIAATTYSDDKNVTFETYASQIIERKMKDYIKMHNSFKNSILNEAVYYDETTNIEIDSNISIEKEMIFKETENELRNELSLNEYKIYELKKEGKTNKAISIILNKSISNIQRALSKIKIKMKNVMEL